MIRPAIILAILYTVSIAAKTIDMDNSLIYFGDYSKKQVAEWIHEAHQTSSQSERIKLLSHKLLYTPYQSNSLVGSEKSPEKFVVNFSGLDCFTYLDYIESMRLAESYDDFLAKLKSIRYQNEQISYQSRNHFFVNWLDSIRVKDMTTTIEPEKAQTVTKFLNQKKSSGDVWLTGIPVVKKSITYIKPQDFSEDNLKGIQTGDYIGIYTDKEGLDVTHVGIAIWHKDVLYFRHASRKFMKVIDQPLKDYIKEKPGVIVYRPV